MTLKELNESWEVSEYDSESYYFRENDCSIGSEAYVATDDGVISKMKIIDFMTWSDNPELYESLPEDYLVDREVELEADTSCEFITKHDCYIVWFKYDS